MRQKTTVLAMAAILMVLCLGAVAGGLGWKAKAQGTFTGGSLSWTNGYAESTLRAILITPAGGSQTCTVTWVSSGVTHTLYSATNVSATIWLDNKAIMLRRGDVLAVAGMRTNSHAYTFLLGE
jgi:hypothetical protein